MGFRFWNLDRSGAAVLRTFYFGAKAAKCFCMAEKYRVEKWKQACPPNPAMLRLILEGEGYRVEQWAARREMIFQHRKFTEDRSYWVVSGSLEMSVERIGTFVLGAGDRNFLPPENYHSARVVSEEPVVYLVGEKIQTTKIKKNRSKKTKRKDSNRSES